MSHADIERWERRYAARQPNWTPTPWVVRHTLTLPPGDALDVAAGFGRHAIYLAARGHRVLAVDGSITALQRGREEAHRRRVAERIVWVQADLDEWRPPAGQFDLIVVVRFLSRPLIPALIRALRPGGCLIYETFTEGFQCDRPGFNPAYLLRRGELPMLVRPLHIHAYEESAAEARLVAIKDPIAGGARS